MAELPYLDDANTRLVQTQMLNRLRYGKNFWLPLHKRMDTWATMYLLLDAIQQSKPLGMRRFISNDPRTAVDAAVVILTRNDVSWHIDQLGGSDENKEELRKLGQIERTLKGIGFDFDEMMSMRLQPAWWVQVAQQALIRGTVWGKAHVTTDALLYRDAPLIGEIYDARTVYPYTDAYGLNYVLIEKYTSLGDMLATYPAEFNDLKDGDPNTPVVKLEYWTNGRGGVPGINACLAYVGSPSQTGGYELTPTTESAAQSRWLLRPYEHGYTPDALPVFGVAVNGLALRAKPALGSILEARLTERADILALQANQWYGPNTWVAEVGRGILSAVEELVPQYNELVATIFQHFSIGTYGTWVFQNQTGEIPSWKPGIEAQIALKPDERVERLDIGPITPDAYRLLQLLQQEREKGVLSNILQAVSPQPLNSAVLFQQIANAALNSLGPYDRGLKDFGTRMARSLLSQFQAASSVIAPFQIVAPTKKNTYLRIEFDPKMDLDATRKYRPVPVTKPALPDDLTVRMTAARMALDPRRPILSLIDVLEDILQRDDPAGDVDRILEDMATTDPVIVLELMAMAMERRGEKEMAARMREAEFKQRFIEDLQFRQISGNVPTGASQSGPSPEAGVPVSETAPAQEPSATEGAALLGAMGERMNP